MCPPNIFFIFFFTFILYLNLLAYEIILAALRHVRQMCVWTTEIIHIVFFYRLNVRPSMAVIPNNFFRENISSDRCRILSYFKILWLLLNDKKRIKILEFLYDNYWFNKYVVGFLQYYQTTILISVPRKSCEYTTNTRQIITKTRKEIYI